jgi:dUTPase
MNKFNQKEKKIQFKTHKQLDIFVNDLLAIDSDFKDSIRVILHNLSSTRQFQVKRGDRIAQLILHRIHAFDNELPPLKDESFEHKGFGSTGA